MDWRALFRPPRRLLLAFFAITLVSTSALGWLSCQIAHQDRALAGQRAQEQRDAAAALAVAALQKHLADAESGLAPLVDLSSVDLSRQLTARAQSLGDDAAFIVLERDRVEVFPA